MTEGRRQGHTGSDGNVGRREAAATASSSRRRILLASPGTPFEKAVVQRVIQLVGTDPARIHVISVAKIWGTRFGLPNRGLYPTKRELEEQQQIVEDAARRLRARGHDVRTRIVKARTASRAIAQWAQSLRCQTIVMADPELPRWRRIVEGSQPREVSRRTQIPVEAVPTGATPRRRAFGSAASRA